MNTPQLLPIALATLRTNFLSPPAACLVHAGSARLPQYVLRLSGSVVTVKIEQCIHSRTTAEIHDVSEQIADSRNHSGKMELQPPWGSPGV